jgi:uncharacterized membrane protein YcaP (DUF421 family)
MPFLAADIQPFDWQRFFLSSDAPPLFLLEIVLRCLIGYLLVLGALRVSGRRGVRQLSIFELSILLALGSAAGDVMVYHDLPVLYAAVAIGVIMGLYWLFNRLTEWFPRFSDWLEGAAVCLVADGCVQHQALAEQNLTQKELFGQLRQLQVEHLGQVRRAYVEATGHITAFFYEDADVRPGLVILPDVLNKPLSSIAEAGDYACTRCGYVGHWQPAPRQECPVCGTTCWLPACRTRRIA